jgi:hypothetical protein
MFYKSHCRQILGWYLSTSTLTPFTFFPFDATYSRLLTAPSNNLRMTVDMQVTDHQRRIVWLIGANDPHKATYQITQYHVRMMLTATVATEASVVYCTGTCGAKLSCLQSHIWPAA